MGELIPSIGILLVVVGEQVRAPGRQKGTCDYRTHINAP